MSERDERQARAEAILELGAANTALDHQFTQIDAIVIGTSHSDIVSLLRRTSENIVKLLKIVEGTPDPNDDVDALHRLDQFKQKMQDKVNDGSFPQEVMDYFVGYYSYLLSREGFSKHSEVQNDVAISALNQMGRAQRVLGWPEINTHLADNAREAIGLTTNAKNNVGTRADYERETSPNVFGRIYDLLYPKNNSIVDWDLLENEPTIRGLGPIHPDEIDLNILYDTMLRGARRVEVGPSGRSAERPLSDADYQYFTKTAIPTLESEIGRFNDPQNADIQGELMDALEIVYRILHEHSVIKGNARNDPSRREFMRPTTKDTDPDIYGEMMMIRGEWGDRLVRAEALGYLLANAADKTKALTADQIEFLGFFSHRISETAERYARMKLAASDVLQPADAIKLDKLVHEIGRYLDWVNHLIAVAGAGAKEDTDLSELSPRIRKRMAELQVTAFSDVVTYSLRAAADRLITADFNSPSDVKAVENAYTVFRERIEEEAEKPGRGNLLPIADMIALMNQMFTDGTLNKSVALDLDYLTVRDGYKEKLQSGNAMERYDDFRSNEFWKNAVGKLSSRALMYMLDAGSKWKAGNAWNGRDHIRPLFTQCHNDLYFGRHEYDKDGVLHIWPPDEEYIAFIDSFPEEGLYNKEDIIGFAKDMAWYSSTFNDHRTYAASIHLGVLKNSYKHRNGQVVDPVAAILNGGYQTKNYDRGKWATLFGAIVVPPEAIAKGTFKLSDFSEDVRELIADGGDPYWDKRFWAGGPGSAPPDPGPAATPAERKQYTEALKTYENGLSQRRGHEKSMQDYASLIEAYFTWMFGEGFFKHFIKCDLDAIYEGQINMDAMHVSPPLTYFMNPPLLPDPENPKGVKRGEENNANNYFQSLEATSKLLEWATTSFKEIKELSPNFITAEDEVRKVAKDLGSEIAKAFGYNWAHKYTADPQLLRKKPIPPELMPAWRAQEAQNQFLRALVQFVLLHLIAELPWSDNRGMLNPFDARVAQYNQHLELLVDVVDGYAKDNMSFNAHEGFFREIYMEITSDPYYRRPARVSPELARKAYWKKWLQVAKHKSGSEIEWELFWHPLWGMQNPTFPYPEGAKSETDARK